MAVTLEQVVVILVLLAALVLFALEIIRAELVALSAMVTLMVTGIVTAEEGVSGFSNAATITVLALFVVSAGVNRTGIVDAAARRLVRFVGDSEVRALLAIFLVAAPASAFLNNTAIVAILLPFAMTLAEHSKVSRSKLLMPLSQITMLAGTVTVIGTSTNVLASGLIEERTGRGFGMFEFTPIGLIILGVGAVYILLVGRHLIPTRIPAGARGTSALLSEFLTEARLKEGSPLVGHPLKDHPLLKGDRLRVVRLVRAPDVALPATDAPLAVGDVLILSAKRADLAHLGVELKVEILGDVAPDHVATGADSLVEVVVAPNSSLVRRSLEDADFAREFGAKVLGIRKLRPSWVPHVTKAQLEFGDTLLLLTDEAGVGRLKRDPDLLVVDKHTTFPFHATKAAMALAVAIAVILSASLLGVPILVSALAGALVMVLTGILRPPDLWTSVRWDVVFLMAGMIPLGIALENTGIADIVAGGLLGVGGGLPDLGIVLMFYVVSMALTAVLSNNGNIVLLTPIAFAVAASAGIDPVPLVLAVMFASSNDFNTPIGYQTNLMVYGPGGYRFLDYARTGLPLSIILAVTTSLAITHFFPLR